jgi:hypothetical protein
MLQKRFYTMLANLGQEKHFRNRTTIKFLTAFGYSPPQIRKALVVLEDINMSEIANGKPFSVSTLYNTVKGRHTGEKKPGPLVNLAKQLFAEELGLDVPELFPENGDNNVPKVATRAA